MSRISDFIIQCDEEAGQNLTNEERQQMYYDKLAKYVSQEWWRSVDQDENYQSKFGERHEENK